MRVVLHERGATLQTSAAHGTVQRLRDLDASFLAAVHAKACWCLSAPGQLAYSTSLACAIARRIGESISDDEHGCFVARGSPDAAPSHASPVSWLTDTQWSSLLHAAQVMPALSALPGALVRVLRVVADVVAVSTCWRLCKAHELSCFAQRCAVVQMT